MTASMRRRFDPIDPSLTILIVPMSPVALDVRAAAELDRAARFEDPHDVAVLLTEEGDRAELLGFVLGGLEGADRRVRKRLSRCQVLDARDLVGAHRRVVREVEAQAVGGDQRSGLLDVLTEDLTERVVDEVGGRVVAADRVAPLDVDRRRRCLAGGDRAVDDARRVAAQVGEGERRVDDLGSAGLGGDRAGVADLATALGVERCLVDEDLDQFVSRTSAPCTSSTSSTWLSEVSVT